MMTRAEMFQVITYYVSELHREAWEHSASQADALKELKRLARLGDVAEKIIAANEVALRIAASVPSSATREVPLHIQVGTPEAQALEKETKSVAEKLADEIYSTYKTVVDNDEAKLLSDKSGQLVDEAVGKAVGDDNRLDSSWLSKLKIATVELLRNRYVDEFTRRR